MDLSAWIWLHRLEFPPRKAHRLLEDFGCPEAIRDASGGDLRIAAADLRSDTRLRLLEARNKTDVSRELDTLDGLGSVGTEEGVDTHPHLLKGNVRCSHRGSLITPQPVHHSRGHQRN